MAVFLQKKMLFKCRIVASERFNMLMQINIAGQHHCAQNSHKSFLEISVFDERLVCSDARVAQSSSERLIFSGTAVGRGYYLICSNCTTRDSS
jgi:hypothetical protein